MTRIKDIASTATSAASDDYIAIDGTTNGSRKILATDVRPALRGALVIRSTNLTGQNYTSGFTAVPWDSEDYDTDTIHDNATNNTRLTTPSGVSYVRITGQIQLSNLTADNFMQIAVLKNGSTTYNGVVLQTTEAGTTSVRCSMSSPILAVVGGTDYFELAVNVESDTSVDVNAANSWFAMEIIK